MPHTNTPIDKYSHTHTHTHRYVNTHTHMQGSRPDFGVTGMGQLRSCPLHLFGIGLLCQKKEARPWMWHQVFHPIILDHSPTICHCWSSCQSQRPLDKPPMATPSLSNSWLYGLCEDRRLVGILQKYPNAFNRGKERKENILKNKCVVLVDVCLLAVINPFPVNQFLSWEKAWAENQDGLPIWLMTFQSTLAL